MFTFAAFAICMGIAGLIAMPLDAWLMRATHNDPPFDLASVVFPAVIILTVVFAIWYLWWRLHGRPADLLAVSTEHWPVRTVACPDTKDEDGDVVRSTIKFILFTPGVKRTFKIPLRAGKGTYAGTGTISVSDGRIRLDAVSFAPAPRLRKGRYGWLEPGLKYDDDSEALIVNGEE
ncbi:hypothetical protein F7D08_0499 [Bifidobacterium cebidarum]|uniref:Uncharacterized protein n=1 Tax=Bifidobacterium cebidarum TaxID=2650773 RepID=A0A6I1GB32_9BIFI|nr:hypothetical protein F7D08_0499 [Bifidobacterium cebidarum]